MFRLICLLMAAALASSANPNNTPDERDSNYTQIRTARLSGEVASVSNLALRRDAGTFLLKTGEIYFLQEVVGKITAAVFIGEGEFRMDPPIAIEKYNLALFTGQGEISETFTELVMHFTDGTYEEIVKQAPTRKGAVNPRAQSQLESRLELLREGKATAAGNIAAILLNSNLHARLLADLYDPGHAGFFNAFIKGKKFPHLMFRLDPQGVRPFDPEEVILASFDDTDMGVWNAFHLSDHYDTEGFINEDHRAYDIEDQRIEAGIKGTDFSARVRTTIDVRRDGPRVLRFDLYPTLRVSRISDPDGRKVSFIQEAKDDDPDVTLIYDEPLTKGKYRIDFEYAGGGALQNDGSGNYTLVARDNWYPASSFGDRATYDMTFRLPKELTMVASGRPLESREEGSQLVTRFKSDIPLAVAGFNFGKFKIKSNRLEEYDFEAYANREIPDDLRAIQDLLIGSLSTTGLMDKARADAEVAVGIYSNYFGKIPYGRLAMTQQTAFSFGQSWPMLVYMPITAFLDSTTRFQLGLQNAADFFKFVGPHEVAHQWWGHMVGWKSYRDQWMSEGFADFSASLFAHLVYKDEKFIDFWKKQRESLLLKNRAGIRSVDIGSVTMGYRIDSAKTAGIGRNMIYPKGAFILHMLRMMMFDSKTGDQRFIAMMKDFVKTHFNQNVATEDFRNIVEKHMTPEMDLDQNGRMDWFFNAYVYGTVVPHYKLAYSLEAQGNKTVARIQIRQSEVSDSFKMLVPVYLELPDKRISRLGVVSMKGNSTHDASVTLDFKPRRLILCAYDDVLAQIDGR